MTISEVVSDCLDKMNIPSHSKSRLYDSAGGELSDDDLDYVNPDEPLFLSQGEPFSKNSSIAIYEEIKPLGQGGFGSVVLYSHKINKRFCAIKFVELSSLSSPEYINMLYSEIGVLMNLKHPNIVQLLDYFPLNDKISLVMEYCSGGELFEYVQTNGPFNSQDCFNVAAQIAQALRYCHIQNIIHRDLKPSNILFASDRSKTIKIVDFGIAGIFAGNQSERSNAGSLNYIAPEVLNGEDNRAKPELDVWSMGCVFYFMLTGKDAFRGASKEEVVRKILNLNYSPLPEQITKPWHKLIKGMLRVDTSKRWDLLRIIEFLHKYNYEPDAPLSEDSDVEERKEVQPEPRKRQSMFVRKSTVAERVSKPEKPPRKSLSRKKTSN